MDTESSTPPAAKKPKVASSERRRFVPGWKNDYPWVLCKEGRMFCELCMDTKKKNAFATGCDKFKKDSLQKHAQTQEHRAALEAASCRKDMQRAVATVYSQQEQAVLAGLRTVYFMAKKNLANDLFSDFKLFQVLQVYLHDLFSRHFLILLTFLRILEMLLLAL